MTNQGSKKANQFLMEVWKVYLSLKKDLQIFDTLF